MNRDQAEPSRNPLVVPQTLLRLEGLAVVIAATGLYFGQGGSWWIYLLLLFLPDLSILGYLANPRLGAALYNLLHNYVGPVALALASWFAGADALVPVALIWLAHIGLDRAVGYGLKLPSGFSDTHLGRIGRG